MDTRIFFIYVSLFIFYGLLIGTQGISKVDDFISSVRNASEDLRWIRMVTGHFGKTFPKFDYDRGKRDSDKIDEIDALFGIHYTDDELNSINENSLLEDSPLNERHYFLLPELKYKKDVETASTEADNDYEDSDYDDNDYDDGDYEHIDDHSGNDNQNNYEKANNDVTENDVSHKITSPSPIPRTKSNHHKIFKSSSTTMEPELIERTNEQTKASKNITTKFSVDRTTPQPESKTSSLSATSSTSTTEKILGEPKNHVQRIKHRLHYSKEFNREKKCNSSSHENRLIRTNQENKTTPNVLSREFNKNKTIFHKTHKPVDNKTQPLNKSRTDLNDNQTTAQPEYENPLSDATTPMNTTEMAPITPQNQVKCIRKRYENFGSSNRKVKDSKNYENRFIRTNQENKTTANFLSKEFNKIKTLFHKTHKPVDNKTQSLNKSRTDLNDNQTTAQPEYENPLSDATTPMNTTEMTPITPQNQVKCIRKRYKSFGSSNRKVKDSRNYGNRFIRAKQENKTTPNFLLREFNKNKTIFHKTHKPVDNKTQPLNKSRTDLNDNQTTAQPKYENPLSDSTTPMNTTEMTPTTPQNQVKCIRKRYKNFGSSNLKVKDSKNYDNRFIRTNQENKTTPNVLSREFNKIKKIYTYEDFINDYLSSDTEINYFNTITGLSTNDRSILKLIKKKLHRLHDFPPPDYHNFSKPVPENELPIEYQDQIIPSKNDLSHEADYKLSKFEQDALEREGILNFSSPLSKWPSRFLDNSNYNILNPSTTSTPFQKALQKNIKKILITHNKNLKNKKFNINDIINPAEFTTSTPNQQVTPLSQQQSNNYNYNQDTPMRRSIDAMQEIKLKVSSRLQSKGYGPSLPSDFLEKSYSNYDRRELFNFKNNNNAAENNDYEFDENQNDYDNNYNYYDFYDYNDVNEVSNIDHKFSKKSISAPEGNKTPQLQNDSPSTTFRIGRHPLQHDYVEILFDKDDKSKIKFPNKSEEHSEKNNFDNKNNIDIVYPENPAIGNGIQSKISDIASKENTENTAIDNGIEYDYFDFGPEDSEYKKGIENNYYDIGSEENMDSAKENGIEDSVLDVGPEEILQILAIDNGTGSVNNTEDSAHDNSFSSDYSDFRLEENTKNLVEENRFDYEYADVDYTDTNEDVTHSVDESGNVNGLNNFTHGNNTNSTDHIHMNSRGSISNNVVNIINNSTNESIPYSSEDFVDIDLGFAENNTFLFDKNVYSNITSEENIPFSLKDFVNTELAHVKNLTHSTNKSFNSNFEQKEHNASSIEEYFYSDFGREKNSQNLKNGNSFENDYSNIKLEENIKNSLSNKGVQNIDTSKNISYPAKEPGKNSNSKNDHIKSANISNSTNKVTNNLTKENISTNKSVNSDFEQKENNTSSIEEYVYSDFESEEKIPSSVDEYVSRDFEYAENIPYSIDENGNPDVVPEESIINLVQKNINYNFKCKFNISNSTIENDYPDVTPDGNNLSADNFSASGQEKNVLYSTNENENNYDINDIENGYYNVDSEKDSSVENTFTNNIPTKNISHSSKNCIKDNQTKTASVKNSPCSNKTCKVANKSSHSEPDRNFRLWDYPNILVNKNTNDDVYSVNNVKYPFKNNDENNKHLITEPKVKLDKVFDNYEIIEKTNDILLNHLPIKPSDAAKIYDTISQKKHDILASLKIENKSLKNEELLNLTKLITETIVQMSNETTTNNTNNVQEKFVLSRNSSNQNETESNGINLKLNVSIDATILSNDSKILNLTGIKFNHKYKKSKKIDPDDDDIRRKRNFLFPNMEFMSQEFRMRSKDDSSIDESSICKFSSDVVGAVYEVVNKDDRLRTHILPGLRKQIISHNKGLKGLNALRTKGNEDNIKRSEKMFKQAVDTINIIIEQQVRSRSCLNLDEDLQEFYDLILQTRRKIYSQKARIERNRYLRTELKKQFRKNESNNDENYVKNTNSSGNSSKIFDEEKQISKRGLLQRPIYREKLNVINNLLKKYDELDRKDRLKLAKYEDLLLRHFSYLFEFDKRYKRFEKERQERIERIRNKIELSKTVQEIEKNNSIGISPNYKQLIKTVEILNKNNLIANQNTSEIENDEKTKIMQNNETK